MRRIRVAALLLGLVCVAPMVSAGPAAAASPSTTINATVGRAYAYAKAHHLSAGIAVLDEKTGQLYERNGSAYFGSASVMKLFVATKLLATGRMHGSTARTAYSMITRSNDSALERLLPLVDHTKVISWVQRRYHIHIGAPSPISSCWGQTQISADGIVRFYRAMQADPAVAPWLMHALHHMDPRAADGTDQAFGLPGVTSGGAYKQGWGKCSSDTGGSVINTTGVIGNGRFAVAALTNTDSWHTNSDSYNATEARHVDRLVHILLPNAYVDLPQYHDPYGAVTATSVRGSTITLHGWDDDPDLRHGGGRITVTQGSTLLATTTATEPSRTIDQAHHISGGHAFTVSVTVPNGSRTYCVNLINAGMGDAAPRLCRRIKVDGSPEGALTDVTSSGAGSIVASGWAYDPDSAPAASRVLVVVSQGGIEVLRRTVLAQAPEPTGTYPVAGAHGFSASVPTATGRYQVCVTALNSGHAAPSAALGCRAVTVSAGSSPAPASTSSTPTSGRQ